MMRQMRTQSDGQKHIDTQLSLTLNFYPVIYYSTCNKFRSTSTLADPNPNYISQLYLHGNEMKGYIIMGHAH